MSDHDPPTSDPPPPESIPPGEPAKEERRRRRLEGVIPEIVRRAVELGVEKASEAPDNVKQFVGDLKLPKEIAHYLLSQIDETKNGLFRVVAKEIRDFLEHTNFAGEMQKILTTVQFEVNTTIRFTPNDGREPRKDTEEASTEGDDDKRADGPASEKGEADDAPPSSRQPLPKPEVKTSVHVRRDDRARRSPRGPRGGA